MKVKFRRGTYQDLDDIFNLHVKCFSTTDCWYKSAIKQHLNDSIIVESINSDDNKIIGVLLQGSIVACNQKLDDDFETNNDYKQDVFEPTNDNGKIFMSNNIHYKNLHGIVMICVDPDFQGKGLAKKLIEKHLQINKNELVCLHTRRSNIRAFMLYKTMGYEHIGYVKNKYFQPNEDSIFMIHE
jgi:ribosomal protein S18 acetylase RimI-like enzyme